MDSIKRVSIVGTGNVATQVAQSLSAKKLELVEVCSATYSNATEFAKKFKLKAVKTVSELKPVDLLMICVPDDAVQNVVNQIPSGQRSAYTSGSVELDGLNRSDVAVFYPLQTFSKEVTAKWELIPILIESRTKEFEAQLFELGNTISNVVRCVDSDYRKRLHVVAVWTNNFVNHILGNAQEIAGQLNVDYKLVLPLLDETIERIKSNSAFEIQTGPAARGDQSTMEKHKELMTDDQSELYAKLSESIIKTIQNHEEL